MDTMQEIEECQQVLRDDPSNFQARRHLAVLLLINGFNEESLKQFKFLSSVFPNDAGLYYNIGIVSEKLKLYDKAEEAYGQAIRLSPQETDFYYNLGLLYIEKREFDKGIVCFKKVLVTDIDDANSYFNLGLCYVKKNELQKAKTYLKKAVELNDEDVFAHFHLGYIYKMEGNIPLAIEKYNKVIDLIPDYSWAYFNLAAIAYELEDFDTAFINLKKTVELNPHDIRAYCVFCEILCKMNELKKAENVMIHALKDNPDNGDLFYNLGQVYKLIGNKEHYIKSLSKATKNPISLTYPLESVKKELKKAKAQ